MPFLRERSGRWSPVKIAAFVATMLPALWIAWQAWTGDLGARPVTEAIHQAGDWALRFLIDHARDHARAAHPELSPHRPGAAHIRCRHGVLRGAASLALRARSAFRPVQGGERDRAARLSADRSDRIDRAHHARRDLDRRRHPPARLAALEHAAPDRLRHRRARRGALLHPVEAQHLRAGADGGLPAVASRLPGALPAQQRRDAARTSWF